MPELPEVETVVRGLRAILPGRSIVGVRLGKTDFIDDPAALGELLPGKRIVSVERIGKFIHLALAPSTSTKDDAVANDASAGLGMVVHLGMTGRLAVRAQHEPIAPHTHGFFELDDGRELRYTDIRRFGRIMVLSDTLIEELRGRLGEDALQISAAEFHRRLSGRRARIKALLLDQTVFRGIGNIYADESLWQARINPARLAARLNAGELTRLWKAVQRVLRAAIRSRGSSISNFVDADGQPGSYQQRHRVYGREGKSCFRCGAIIKRAIIAGRSSCFCPICQPPPRVKRTSAREPRRRSKR